MSTRVQEVYSLSVWYQDVLHRYEQLAAWTSGSLTTPHSVWLSGLFNPKAFLTAVSTLGTGVGQQQSQGILVVVYMVLDCCL